MAITIYRPEQITGYGADWYKGSMMDWSKMIYKPYQAMMKQVTPALGETMKYYRPGGGYGAGQRMEAEEQVYGGLSKDLASMVATGMGSQFVSRGLRTGAGAELSKLYKNIEDTRAQLEMQSFTPYAQIMSQMANLFQTRPTSKQFVTPFHIPSQVTTIPTV